MELILGLLAAASLLSALARPLGVPYPVVLVLGGAVLALIPGMPRVAVSPDVVFLVFLPPLLYEGAFSVSLDALRGHVAAMLVLAVGLVLATMLAVAAVAHWVAGLPWPYAFVLGATLAATDPVSATAIIRRLGAPREIATILEGEALINDGTALTAFKVALGALGAGGFSLGDGVAQFGAVALGGAAAGAVVALVAGELRRRLDDPNLEVTIGVMTAYGAYIVADRLHVSGVLAAVAAGLLMSRLGTSVSTPRSRLRSLAFWEVATFIASALLFLLIGLELRPAVDGIGDASAAVLAGDAAAIIAVLLLVRLAFVVTGTTVSGRLLEATGRRALREGIVLGMSGMRGALTVAAALSVPIYGVTATHGQARALVVFLAFAATLATIALPGLALPTTIRLLGLSQGERARAEELTARRRLVQAALAELDRLDEAGEVPDPVLLRVRSDLELRAEELEGALGRGAVGPPTRRSDLLAAERRVRRTLLTAEDAALAELRSEQSASPELLRDIGREIDVEVTRMRSG